MSTRECLSPVDKNQFPICWKHSFVSWTRSMTTDGESRGKLREKNQWKSPFSERLTENQCWWRVRSLCKMGVTNVWCDPGLRFSSRVAAAEILHRPGDTRGRAGARGTVSVRQLWVTGLLQINIHSENDHRCLVWGTLHPRNFCQKMTVLLALVCLLASSFSSGNCSFFPSLNLILPPVGILVLA